MLVVPEATPATVPVVEPTVAIAVLPLIHVPEPVPSLSVTEPDGQTGALLVIAAVAAVTVREVVTVQRLVLV